MSRIKLEEKRNKYRYLVNCLKDEKEFIDKVARLNGFQPTAFVRDAALEKAKELYKKKQKTYIQEALEILDEIEKKDEINAK